MDTGFRVVSTATIFVAVICAFADAALSYLTISSARAGKCLGQRYINGFQSDPSYYVFLLLAGCVIVWMAMAIRKSREAARMIEVGDITVFEFLAFRLTYGQSLIYGMSFLLALISALVTFEIAKSYFGISELCRSVKALSFNFIELRELR